MLLKAQQLGEINRLIWDILAVCLFLGQRILLVFHCSYLLHKLLSCFNTQVLPKARHCIKHAIINACIDGFSFLDALESCYTMMGKIICVLDEEGNMSGRNMYG